LEKHKAKKNEYLETIKFMKSSAPHIKVEVLIYESEEMFIRNVKMEVTFLSLAGIHLLHDDPPKFHPSKSPHPTKTQHQPSDLPSIAFLYRLRVCFP
jgi:hypothetical protein